MAGRQLWTAAILLAALSLCVWSSRAIPMRMVAERTRDSESSSEESSAESSALQHPGSASVTGSSQFSSSGASSSSASPVGPSSIGSSIEAPFTEQVANTLNGLNGVLEKLYQNVKEDESVFKEFRSKMIDNEVAKAGNQLSWDAIRKIVDDEVALGRKQIANKVGNFKIDVLDVVQKGLDALRGQIRATVTTPYAPSLAGGMSTESASVTASASASKRSSSSASGSRAAQSASAAALASARSPNFDAVDAAASQSLSQGKPSLVDDVTRLLDGTVTPADKEAIRQFIADKLSHSKAFVAAKAKHVDSYGEDPKDALASLEAALKGKLSSHDLDAELLNKLRTLTKQHLAKPSAETKKALQALEKELLARVDKADLASKVHASQSTAGDEDRSMTLSSALHSSSVEDLSKRIHSMADKLSASQHSSSSSGSSESSEESSSHSGSSSLPSNSATSHFPSSSGKSTGFSSSRHSGSSSSSSSSSESSSDSPSSNDNDEDALHAKLLKRIEAEKKKQEAFEEEKWRNERLGPNAEPEYRQEEVVTQKPEVVERRKDRPDPSWDLPEARYDHQLPASENIAIVGPPKMKSNNLPAANVYTERV